MINIYAVDDVKIPGYQGTDFEFIDKNVADIIGSLFNYLLPLAGILMFAMIVYGGLTLMLSGGNPEGVKEGTNKILFGVVGFIVVFTAYWIIKIIEIIFGIQIL
jgi:hypothetical protein